MKYTQGKYLVTEKKALAKDVFSIVISCPEIVQAASAGQFVHILPKGCTLRRPISICDINKENGTIRIVFVVKGEGTKEIASVNEGEVIDMLAPLGHGFTVNKNYKKVILVGGGIGTPPMLNLARIYGKNAVAISGFRSAENVILQNDFKNAGAETILCTDDGATGIKGFVTQPLEDILKKESVDAVYSCGPLLMLKNIAAICDKYNTYCEVSLEERMGCGIGACLVCACKTHKDGNEHFSHVCKDGPVFDSREVVW